MNKSEQKTYEWLRTNGYVGIKYHPTSSPDFTTSTIGFEVKNIRNKNQIIFSYKQWEFLKALPNIIILVYNNEIECVAQIPFKEISNGNRVWNNLHVSISSIPIIISEDTYLKLLKRRGIGQQFGGIIAELLKENERLHIKIQQLTSKPKGAE